MLCTWISMGEPYYEYMHATSQHIVYISDIGATSWGKPIFIATSAVTVVSFDLVFILERWLRHKRRLVQNYRTREKVLSGLAIVWSIVGAAALILLTIFDTKNYNKVHDSMLGVFMYVPNNKPIRLSTLKVESATNNHGSPAVHPTSSMRSWSAPSTPFSA